jgi:hypothetical protein
MKKLLPILFSLFLISFFILPFKAYSQCQTCGNTAFSGMLEDFDSETPETTTPAGNNRADQTEVSPSFSMIRLERLQYLNNQLKEKRAEIQARIEENQETTRERVSERRRIRIRAFFNQMVLRIEAAISRLLRLIDRIEARLDKIELADETIDTEKIRQDLNLSQGKLNRCQTALEEAKESLEDILSSETPKEDFSQIKELIREIKSLLIEIHLELVDLIDDIKGLRVGLSGQKTPVTEAAETGQPIPEEE